MPTPATRALLAALTLASPARAAAPAPAAASTTQTAAAPLDDLRRGHDERQDELRGVQDSIAASDARRKAIEAEIASVEGDRAKLAAALVDAAGKAQAADARLSAAESRLDAAQSREAGARRSLEGRRAVIAQVLAALQRIGRKPPPAVLVSPEDMLHAVRAAMLLGAVVPGLRAETQALAADLAALAQARAEAGVERDAVAADRESLAGERQRLSALVDARRGAAEAGRRTLEAERARAADLARHASDLKDLVARMEGEIGSAAKAAEAARAAEEAQRKAQSDPGQAEATRLALAAPFRDPARLAPAIAFADARGHLPQPVAGAAVKSFGQPDGFGAAERGVSIATRPQAAVSSPADAWVSYAGPYRTYGQLLILNAGGGYYIVLAGMERITVDVGQFVLAGEPVAAMGDGSAKTAAAIAIGATQPVLYVEFRKDGTAIDPGPWWAKPERERIRG